MAEKPEQEQDMNAPSIQSNFFIIGIGASAGGVQALKVFFENVPIDSGMAYVVILHLSPDHDSHLTQLLQNVTQLPVQQVVEKVRVQPNHVYVVPPNQHLMMEEGMLNVSTNILVEERRAPVDIFFRTLAESHRTNAVAVVLSGTGANGSMGLKRVKEKGGAVFVQNPREAEFSEMPRNAIATELVDEVLPVADIPLKIISYRRGQETSRISLEVAQQPQDQQQALREIFTQLRLRTGHDFTNYKRPTLLRRIERRISIHNLPDLPTYTAYLVQHPDEINSLLKDLLISVTNFFRDKKAFEELENSVLSAIFQGKNSADQIRIWIAGCATGEEAYSLAILCAERTLSVLDSPKVQLFATDIDDAAIATAREGFYTLNDAADVSPERLRRFFTKEGDGYRIRREIREMVLFASHNFLKDPPFSHLHLISCRNVLIYLNHTAQERVMETFHFALNPGGFLFLGTSESTDTATDLYSNYSREHHIFQSRQAGNRIYPVPESVPAFRQLQPPAISTPAPETTIRPLDRITYGDLHQRLLEQFAPPSMVVNEEYDIIHLSERAGRYLQIAGGELSRNLLKLVRPELRLELRSALYQASQRQLPVEVKGQQLSTEDGTEKVNIQVRPVLQEGDNAKGFILIIFSPAEPGTENNVVFSSEEPVARHLEQELMRLKVQLRSSNEQHEFQAEELKAANEELQAMNEELRSAAEELETSKEELQSINEELTTVNQELKVKVEEVSMVGSNLQNLINSTDMGTIFLDRSFRVVLFTPSARNIFNLIPADYGRSLSDITSKLDYSDIISDAELVLEKLQAIEKEVVSLDEHTYLMRILPYRTVEDRIQGVVITFIDITERMQAEEILRQAEEKYRTQLEKDVADRTIELKESQHQYQSLVENTPDIIIRWDKHLRLQFANGAHEARTGVPRETAFGKTEDELGQPAETANPYMDKLRQVFATGEEAEHFSMLTTPQGTLPLFIHMVPEKNEEGEVATVLTIGRDISELKTAQQEIIAVKEELAQKATDRYQRLFNSIDEGFCLIKILYDSEGKPYNYAFAEANPAFVRQSGFTDPVGKTAKELVPDQKDFWVELYAKVAMTGESVRFENEVKDKGIVYDVYAFPYGSPNDHLVGVLFKDTTERKRAEQVQHRIAGQDAFRVQLADALRPLTNAAQIQTEATSLLGKFLQVNQAHYGEPIGDHIYVHQGYGYEAPPIVGSFPLTDLGERMIAGYRNGATQVSYDTQTDANMVAAERAALAAAGVMAYIAVPLVKEGVWVATFTLHSKIPRQWANDEITLVQETAERTWLAVERAKTEKALTESEERLRQAMESASIIWWDINLTTNQLQVSDNYEAVFGFSLPHGLDGAIAIIKERMHPDDIQLFIEAIDSTTHKKETFEVEYRMVHSDTGETIWTASYGTLLMDSSGQKRIVGIAQNITAKKLAEEELRISEERYRTVLQSAEMGAWDWNIVEDTVAWNREHYTMLGADLTHQPMDSAYFIHFIYPDDKERVTNTLFEAIATGGIYQADFRIVRDDNGDIRWMSGFGRVAAVEGGQATRMVGVMSDITERKKLEQQREDFLGFASHELKTPVTSIKAYTQILLEMFEMSDDQKSVTMMRKLDKQVNRLTNLINDLLDTTKIAEGQLALRLETFDFNELMQERTEDLQRLSENHKLVIELCEDAHFTADKERIGQVITNLVSNAIKYSPLGKEIIISCQHKTDGIHISVQDFGIGIPEEVQRRVFDRFFRVKDAQTQTFPGLGLGLYITAGIVHRHGGAIWVNSNVGEGSTFHFTLPIGKEAVKTK